MSEILMETLKRAEESVKSEPQGSEYSDGYGDSGYGDSSYGEGPNG